MTDDALSIVLLRALEERVSRVATSPPSKGLVSAAQPGVISFSAGHAAQPIIPMRGSLIGGIDASCSAAGGGLRGPPDGIGLRLEACTSPSLVSDPVARIYATPRSLCAPNVALRAREVRHSRRGGAKHSTRLVTLISEDMSGRAGAPQGCPIPPTVFAGHPRDRVQKSLLFPGRS